MLVEDAKPYDPLISGLEPESYDTVFQELFAGAKSYLTPSEPVVETRAFSPPSMIMPMMPDMPNVLEDPIGFIDDREDDYVVEVIPSDPVKEVVDEVIEETLMKQPVLAAEPAFSTASRRRMFPVKTIPFVNENVPQSSSALMRRFPNFNAQRAAPATVTTRNYPMLRCGHCHDIFISHFVLEHHETKCHPQLFGWFCAECNVHFDTMKHASDHTATVHGEEEMPVYDRSLTQMRKQGLPSFMQMVTKSSSDFVNEYLISRENNTVMTAAYFTYAKLELQAVCTGNISIYTYHQARTDLLSIHDATDHEDMIRCLKNYYIYGPYIKRVPLITYSSPATVYRTLTVGTLPKNPVNKTTLRNVVAHLPHKAGQNMKYNMRQAYRNNPYPPIIRSPATAQIPADPFRFRTTGPRIIVTSANRSPNQQQVPQQRTVIVMPVRPR